MKFTTIFVAVAVCVALVSSSPVSQSEKLQSQVLERLMMIEGANPEALRNKRTIGVLRQLFPRVTAIIDDKVNAIVTELIRILGPTVIQSVLRANAPARGASGTTKNSDAGTTVELPLPTDDDDDDDDSSSKKDNDSKVNVVPPAISSDNDEDSSSNKDNDSKVTVVLPDLPSDEDDDSSSKKDNDLEEKDVDDDEARTTTTTTTTTTMDATGTSERKRRARRTRSARPISAKPEEPAIEDTAESQNNEVRVQFADEQPSPATNEVTESELTPIEDVEVTDDENRNKRFLNFGFGASGGAGANAGAGGAGSGGGSGNFLFDIIRQAADGAARAAGTVYRVVAGTQSLGLGLSATRDVGPAPPVAPAPSAPAGGPAPSAPAAMAAPAAAPAPGAGMQPPLVAGSGSSQANDVAAGAPTPGGRVDGTAEAVPGPVTRLFVIANRGISNLIQDLILRLAATSERIVNFKARLITSII